MVIKIMHEMPNYHVEYCGKSFIVTNTQTFKQYEVPSLYLMDGHIMNAQEVKFEIFRLLKLDDTELYATFDENAENATHRIACANMYLS